MSLRNALVGAAWLLTCAAALAQPSPASADEALGRGTEAIRAGRFAEAEQWLEQAVKLSPENPAAHMELGVAQLRTGKPNDAVEHLRQAAALGHSLAGVHLFLGIAYAQMHRVEESAAAFRRETEIAPGDAQAWMWLGIVELQDGHPEKATGPLDRAAELTPNDLTILEYRGTAHTQVAFASYARMAVIDPTSWHVHHVQGQIYSQQNQHAEAIAEFLEALKQAPNNADLYEELGEEYRKSGHLDLAQQAYSKELALSPSNPIAMFNLAKIDIEMNRTAEGLDLLHKVASVYANAPAAYFYLGLGEFDAGRASEALAALEKAKSMHPDPELEPRIEYELSRVYHKLGREEDASRAVREYTRLKARNSKLNPRVLSAIGSGFGQEPTPGAGPKADQVADPKDRE
jgi:Flp pilus assembly protein TadD